jgi:6-phosphogluconolactonase
MSTGANNVATEPGNVRWHPFAESGALRDDARRRVIAAAKKAIDERGRFAIVLAGGSTPRALYRSLQEADTDWSRWHVYFGDERCVAADDAERNSVMAAATLLFHVPIPRMQIHDIPAEFGAAHATRIYSRTLRDAGEFDLVLLGLGEDGHMASLFPGYVPDPSEADVIAVFDAPKPPPERVSLSAARLSRTRAALFLVEGESKREAVRRWRDGADIPAAAIRPRSGVDVLVDARLLD